MGLYEARRIAVRLLKRGAKNPDSFQLDAAGITAAGALCVSYRATNSFNAMVPGYAVVPAEGKASAGSMADVLKAWTKHCKGQATRDMSHVRYGL